MTVYNIWLCTIYDCVQYILARVIFSHPHSPVDRGEDQEEEGDPPLADEDAALEHLVITPIILWIVLSQGIHLGLFIPEYENKWEALG